MAQDNQTALPMMKGTEGNKDYLAFARKGPVALGVKPIAAQRGEAYQQPDHVYFALRLRSAPAYGVFPDVEETLTGGEAAPVQQDSKVVAFKPKAAKPEDDLNTSKFATAWPNVVWANASSYRASTIIGVLLKGSVDSIEGTKLLIENISDSKLASMVADHLISVCRKQNLVLEREQIIAWLDEQYAVFLDNLKKSVTARENLAAEMSASAGTVMNQAELIKKLAEKTNTPTE